MKTDLCGERGHPAGVSYTRYIGKRFGKMPKHAGRMPALPKPL